MGLVVFGAIALYLLVSVVVVIVAARQAHKRGRSAWRWGGLAALAMYLLVFWDHIPTLLMHKYYCETEAGFWVYKTVEQWKQENPGVIKTLDRKREVELYNSNLQNRFWTTQRFYTDVIRTTKFHAVQRTEEVFVDNESKQVISRSINFFRGRGGNVFAMGGSLDDFRQALVFGWGNRECGRPSATDQMNSYRYEFQKLGEGK